jgi:hypothetical protein
LQFENPYVKPQTLVTPYWRVTQLLISLTQQHGFFLVELDIIGRLIIFVDMERFDPRWLPFSHSSKNVSARLLLRNVRAKTFDSRYTLSTV